MKSSNYYALAIILTLSCQSTPKDNLENALEVKDILQNFNNLSPKNKKNAQENGWSYFSYVFNFNDFQKNLLLEFPSLGFFGEENILIGRTPLDLRFLHKNTANPAALLLAIDLEMEILSRFHTSQHKSPRCLEDFWSEWGISIASHLRGYSGTFRSPTQSNPSLNSAENVALNEESSRLAAHLRQSLNLEKDTPLKLLGFEDPIRAQFLVNDHEIYEIFSSPVECKALQNKQFTIPNLGKMKCLQKQSAAWVSVPAKESTVLSDDWVSEVKHRCQRWVRPLSDNFRKKNPKLKEFPFQKSWSFYPRLTQFIKKEADRYEAAFRQNIK